MISKRIRKPVAIAASTAFLALLAGCGQSAEKGADQTIETQNAVVKPSFDCSKASKPQEKLICSDSELAELDVKLSDAYSKAIKSGDKASVLQSQRQWIGRSFNACSDKPCLVAAYQARIADLENPVSLTARNDALKAVEGALVAAMRRSDDDARKAGGNPKPVTSSIRDCQVSIGFGTSAIDESTGDISFDATMTMIYDFKKIDGAGVSPSNSYVYNTQKPDMTEAFRTNVPAKGYNFVVYTTGEPQRILMRSVTNAGGNTERSDTYIPTWWVEAITQDEAESVKLAFEQAIRSCR